MARLRGDKIAMIFQEPMTSLNPAYTVGSQMAEVMQRHRRLGRRAALDRAAELLGARRHHRARHAARPVPAPALGRAAPARDDRHEPDVRARAADRGRAHHRARRHRAGADPAPAAGIAARARPRHPAHHARSRHRRARRAPRLGDVCGRDRRERGRRRSSSRCPRIPIRAACSIACRCPARCAATSSSAASRAWCRASRPASSAAPSATAARMQGRIARCRCRGNSRRRSTTISACCRPTMRGPPHERDAAGARPRSGGGLRAARHRVARRDARVRAAGRHVRQGAARGGRRRRVAHRAVRQRHGRSSANPAAASRRSRASSSACWSRSPAAC